MCGPTAAECLVATKQPSMAVQVAQTSGSLQTGKATGVSMSSQSVWADTLGVDCVSSRFMMTSLHSAFLAIQEAISYTNRCHLSLHLPSTPEGFPQWRGGFTGVNTPASALVEFQGGK